MANGEGKLNLTFTDQLSYLNGVHRSGWPFVMNQLKTLHNDNGVWCDTYVDRTFHWAKPHHLPYTRPWVGFSHHTFDTTHSDYNNVNLLKDSSFLQSLPHCKGLFVFSKALQERWVHEFALRGLQVPVVALTHPTETVGYESRFSMDAFRLNRQKKLISIGAWLRDSFAIYKLNEGKGPIIAGELQYAKTALQGPRMQGYFKPTNFFRAFTQPSWRNFDSKPPVPGVTVADVGSVSLPRQRVLSVNGELPAGVIEASTSNIGSGEDTMCRDIMCRDSTYALNKYVSGALGHLKALDQSVTILPTATDEVYDTLLKDNVIFLNLIDAGAVNTILECVVRNTPILVNRLPSIEEILGEDYPLFYDALPKDGSLLTFSMIEAAHQYLDRLDKSKLTADHFLSAVISSEIYNSLT